MCLVTSRGCSCDLLCGTGTSPPANFHARQIGLAFQQGIIAIAREVGSVRLLVHRHAGPPTSRCRIPHPRARFSLDIHEVTTCKPWFVEDVLMEVHRQSSSAHLQVS